MAERNSLTIGRVRGLGRGGDGVVATDRGVVFVAGALPGEKVRFGAPSKKGKVRRAPLLEVLEPVEGRVEPPCALAARCGGCPLMHADPALSLRLKEGILRSALGSLWPAEAPLPVRSFLPRLGYRRRARMAFEVRRGGRLGYREARSRRILDVPRCEVLLPALAEALTAIRARLLPHLEGEGELHLALGGALGGEGEGGLRPVLALHSEAAQPPALYDAVRALIGEGAFAGIALRVGGVASYATFGDPRERSVHPDGGPFLGAIAGFSQAHEAANAALVRAVAQQAQPDPDREQKGELLELFAGAGNLSLALAEAARERGSLLRCVESFEGSVEALKENLAARDRRAKVVLGDALRVSLGRPEVVVLDPPRTGAKELMPRLRDCGASRIVYVSCEPTTLARDLRTLTEGPYRLEHVEAFDMFPQTAHMETLATLVRAR